MTATRETLREAVARAIRAEFDDELNGTPTGTNLVEVGCEYASYTDPIDAADCFIKASADAAIAAIEAAGWRVVNEGVELPCRVALPPATIIGSGCRLGTLIDALERRGMASPRIAEKE